MSDTTTAPTHYRCLSCDTVHATTDLTRLEKHGYPAGVECATEGCHGRSFRGTTPGGGR